MGNNKNFSKMRNLIIVLFLSVQIFASVQYNCHYDESSLRFSIKKGWDQVSIKGGGFTKDEGEPILPIDFIHLIIPQGHSAESISVKVNHKKVINGSFKIKSFLDNVDSIVNDSNFYLSNEPYPGNRAKIVRTGFFNGNNIVYVKVYPLDYYPKSGEIILFEDFTIEIFHRPLLKPKVRQFHKSPYSKYLTDKTLRSLVDNDSEIPVYSYKSYYEDYKNQGKSFFTYPEYLVITTDSLINEFEPLTFWITKKGIKAEIVSVDSIIKNYDYIPIFEIFDDAGIIRSYLRGAYENGTQWVLLGGDEEIIPVRYGTSENNDTTVPQESPPSDLYYSSLDGNWNVDGDELYGEPIDDSVDIYPELYVGRLPCNKKEEVENWINKVLSYEKNPGNGNFDYLNRIFWTAADEMRDFPDYIIENGSYPSYFEHDTSMLEDSFGYSPTGSEVIDQMNNNYGWFNHYGHGAPDQLTVSALHYNEAGPDRDFIVSLDSCDVYFENINPNACRVEVGNGLDSLSNKDYYGIMYLASCYQGMYDHEHYGGLFEVYCGPSMAEAFTMLPERGGPAFLGYTRYAKDIPSEVLHLNFLETLYEDSLLPIGVTEAISKTKVFPHFIHLSHTLFGCPLMSVWTNLPSYFNVTFDDSIPPDSNYFQVIVEKLSGPTIKDAYVCLWKGDEVYQRGFTGVDGKLILPIEPETEGEMFITVTRENFIPFEDTVYVSINANIVDDLSKSPPFCKTKSILSMKKVLFEFYIPETDIVKLDIFDITGRKVKNLLDKRITEGNHSLYWNQINSSEKEYTGGIYFYRFKYKEYIIKGKFISIK
jgi:hypothetical protein